MAVTFHRIRVECTSEFALLWLFARLGRLEHDHPELKLDVRPTDCCIDDAAPLSDVEIRFVFADSQFKVSAAQRSVEFSRTEVIPVASPDYLSSAANIRYPTDLLAHQLLHEESYSWTRWLAEHGVGGDLDLSGPRLWQCPLTINAAKRGNGIALANRLMVAEELSAGTLVEVGATLRSFAPKTQGHWHFICRADRWEAPGIAEFRGWLARATAP